MITTAPASRAALNDAAPGSSRSWRALNEASRRDPSRPELDDAGLGGDPNLRVTHGGDLVLGEGASRRPSPGRPYH